MSKVSSKHFHRSQATEQLSASPSEPSACKVGAPPDMADTLPMSPNLESQPPNFREPVEDDSQVPVEPAEYQPDSQAMDMDVADAAKVGCDVGEDGEGKEQAEEETRTDDEIIEPIISHELVAHQYQDDGEVPELELANQNLPSATPAAEVNEQEKAEIERKPVDNEQHENEEKVNVEIERKPVETKHGEDEEVEIETRPVEEEHKKERKNADIEKKPEEKNEAEKEKEQKKAEIKPVPKGEVTEPRAPSGLGHPAGKNATAAPSATGSPKPQQGSSADLDSEDETKNAKDEAPVKPKGTHKDQYYVSGHSNPIETCTNQHRLNSGPFSVHPGQTANL